MPWPFPLRRHEDDDTAPRKPSALDYELDPLLRLEKHARSTREAIAYVIAIPLLTILTAGIILLISHTQGGPICDAGQAHWVCNRTTEVLLPLIPGAVALAGAVGTLWITYFKWARYDRWRPWLATIWPLFLFFLGWVTSTGTMLIIGHR
ncbi:MAG: hypothetical protein Q4G37_02035 [Bifidobacterium sp.]|nr:hypothetical protein [Bifidobacterium sp.]